MKIAKLSGGSASKYYYEKDPIFNAEGKGENLEWHGVQAQALGLEGKVEKDVFKNILDGKSPDGSVQLRDKSHKTGKSRDAYDLTLAAPKSVSLLALNAEDNKLIDAHKEAVRATLEFVEKNYSNVQKTEVEEFYNPKTEKMESKNIKVDVNNENMLIAVAHHSTARGTKDDKTPQAHLHTHAVIINQVFDKETGEYRALSVKELFTKTQLINTIYKSELAKNITNLGYKIETKDHGFDIKMDQKLIDNFSNRKNEILKEVAETGAKSMKEKEIIQHKNKQDKIEITASSLKANWEQKINDMGYDGFKQLNDEAIGENHYDFSKKEILEKVTELMVQNDAVIKDSKLLMEATKASFGKFTYFDLKEELSAVSKIGQKQDSDMKLLGYDKKGEKLYTNKEMCDVERSNKNFLRDNKRVEGIMTKEQAEKGLKAFEDANFKLSDGQKESAINILSSDKQIGGIQGVAGSGKTTMLKAVNFALEHNNIDINVKILAPTNKASSLAAEESKLENGKGFEASTIAKHILTSDSVNTKEIINNINESAKKVSQNKVKENVKNEQSIKSDTKNDQSVKKEDVSVKSEAPSAKAKTEKIDTSLQAELYARTGNKAFTKGSKKIFGAKKSADKEGMQYSSKHKKGRSTQIKGGQFDGAIKKESWKKKNNYESTVTFKDGSKFKTTIKTYGKDNALSSVVSSGKNVTKISNIGDKQQDKSSTFLGLTYATKNVINKIGDTQNKKSFDVLKLASLEKNVVERNNNKIASKSETKTITIAGVSFTKQKETLDLKDQNVKKITDTKQKGFMGFKKTVKQENIYDKNGKILRSKKITDVSFMGKSFSQKIEVDNIKKEQSVKKDSAKESVKSDAKKESVKDVSNLKVNEKINDKETLNIDKNIETKVAKEVLNNNVEIKEKKTLYIVDESSMLGERDAQKLFQSLGKNEKMVFMGDEKQLKSIGAGDAFKEIKQNVTVSEMPESQRQHTKSEQIIARNVRDETTTEETFKELKRAEKIHEHEDKDKLFEKIATAAVKIENLTGEAFGKEYTKEVDYKNNITLSAKREDVATLNNMIRDKLHESGQINKNDNITATVKVPKNISAEKQLIAANFKEGDKVTTFSKIKGMAQGKEYEIIDLDKEKNVLSLKAEGKNGKDIYTKVSLKEAAGKLSATSSEEKSFSKGDIVLVTVTDKKQDILNSDRGIVTNLDKENNKITVDFGDNKIKDIDMSKDVGLSLGYSTTNHKSQGISVDRVQSHTDCESGGSLNSFHVQQTRQKLKSEVFTDDVEKLEYLATKEQKKSTTKAFDNTNTLSEEPVKTEAASVKAEESVKDEITADPKDSKTENIESDTSVKTEPVKDENVADQIDKDIEIKAKDISVSQDQEKSITK